MSSRAYRWYSHYDKSELVVWADTAKESADKITMFFDNILGLKIYPGNLVWSINFNCGMIYDD